MNAKFLRLSKLKSLRKTEQVAAVCYRMRGADIEFLLVQTGGGRWIFPKGCVEPGLTHAQAAAIEAFEEAGVHGRIEEKSFVRYQVRRAGNRNPQIVTAHLCEVLRLSAPQETGRNRTWFSPEKSKRRLQKDRPVKEGAGLARVVSRAVICIQKSREQNMPVSETAAAYYKPATDPLQAVQFEARGQRQGQIDALYMRYIQRLRIEQVDDPEATGISRSLPRLNGAVAAASAIQKVTAIDQARRSRARV